MTLLFAGIPLIGWLAIALLVVGVVLILRRF